MGLAWTWAKSFGGDTGPGNQGTALAVDSTGHVYAAGTFSGKLALGQNVIANPGPGADLFLVKYTPDGAFMWVAWTTGAGNIDVADVCVDDHNRPHVAGNFMHSTTFTNGPASLSLSNNNVASHALFLAQFSAAGAPQWVTQVSGPGVQNFVRGISPSKGSIYLTGNFDGTADFGTPPNTISVVSNGAGDFCLARYSASGAIKSVVTAGNAIADDSGRDVAATPAGIACVTGNYYGAITLGAPANPITLVSPASQSFFVAKYDGKKLLWATSPLSTGGAEIYSIANDSAGDVVVAGDFTDTLKFTNAVVLKKQGFAQVQPFIAKYDKHGQFVWAVAGHGQDASAVALAIDALGDIYVAGEFYSKLTFIDTAQAEVTLTSGNGNGAVFVLRLDAFGKLAGALTACGVGAKDKVTGYEIGLASTADGRVFLTTGFVGAVRLSPSLEVKCAPGHEQDVLLARIG